MNVLVILRPYSILFFLYFPPLEKDSSFHIFFSLCLCPFAHQFSVSFYILLWMFYKPQFGVFFNTFHSVR
jgi:hypothetical protein